MSRRGSLYSAMLMMVILPMTLVTVVAFILCGNYYLNAINQEVEKELSNICAIVRVAMDDTYPGDYSLIGDTRKAVLKGESVLNGDFTVVDRIKEVTGVEVTIFYYDTRILTTIMNKEGERIVGTGANARVMKDVYEGGEPAFYTKVDIVGQDYYSFYEPLKNSDGSVVGMTFAGKRVEDVRETSLVYMLPMILIMLVLIILEGIMLMAWTRNAIRHLGIIQSFLMVMSEGKFSRELSPVITGRDDEIGRLGSAVVKVQYAIRELIERDMLTGLHNRRFGYARLEELRVSSIKNGLPFSICMCDIDYFKSINDTYGHDAGDYVLKEVAKLFRTSMSGKGFAIRWGGEEFLIVFSSLDMDQALPVIEDIRSRIKALKLRYINEDINITMSFGVANGSSNVVADSFIKEADDRLYYAKENGRDQIVSLIPWWKEEKEVRSWQPEVLVREEEAAGAKLPPEEVPEHTAGLRAAAAAPAAENPYDITILKEDDQDTPASSSEPEGPVKKAKGKRGRPRKKAITPE